MKKVSLLDEWLYRGEFFREFRLDDYDDDMGTAWSKRNEYYWDKNPVARKGSYSLLAKINYYQKAISYRIEWKNQQGKSKVCLVGKHLGDAWGKIDPHKYPPDNGFWSNGGTDKWVDPTRNKSLVWRSYPDDVKDRYSLWTDTRRQTSKIVWNSPQGKEYPCKQGAPETTKLDFKKIDPKKTPQQNGFWKKN